MSFTRKSEDSLAVRLVPKLGDPDEVLQDGLSERDEIVFDSSSDGNELVVGRGPLTGIVDGAVQSTAFRLSYDELCFENHCVRASLMVTDESNLYINGLPWDEGQPYVYLIHGDDVALDGLRYEYKVQIESGSSGPPSGKKRKAESSDVISVLSSSPEPEEKRDSLSKKSVSSSTIAVPQENADRITDEIQCSVCLDIQVRSRTLNPCGHSFCGSCLNQLEQCPQCREKIVSHVPALQLDGLIASLVSVPNLLDKDDVEHYNERKSSTCKKVSSRFPVQVRLVFRSWSNLYRTLMLQQRPLLQPQRKSRHSDDDHGLRDQQLSSLGLIL
jgi:hypothetical protein